MEFSLSKRLGRFALILLCYADDFDLECSFQVHEQPDPVCHYAICEGTVQRKSSWKNIKKVVFYTAMLCTMPRVNKKGSNFYWINNIFFIISPKSKP